MIRNLVTGGAGFLGSHFRIFFLKLIIQFYDSENFKAYFISKIKPNINIKNVEIIREGKFPKL